MSLSSGEFCVAEVADETALLAEMQRLQPAEILVPESSKFPPAVQEFGCCRQRDDRDFDRHASRQALLDQLGTHDLSGFGCEDLGPALSAAGALLVYARETQRSALPHLKTLKRENCDEALVLDASSRRNLEIDQQIDGSKKHTLLRTLDRAVTPMGSRMLAHWLNRPLRDVQVVRRRQQSVAALRQHFDVRQRMQKTLSGVGDIQRSLARVALRSAMPGDLVRLRDALQVLPELQQHLAGVQATRLADLAGDIGLYPELAELLGKALVERPPAVIRDGGVIARGYDSELDALKALTDDSGKLLLELEERERDATGIDSLKVGFNRVHGYYLEISRRDVDQAPAQWMRRQTLKNVERFITPELKRFEDASLSAKSRALAREKWLYDELLARLASHLPALGRTASGMAEVDVLACFAECADSLNLVCPELLDTPAIHIQGGRHPVVEAGISGPFIANDTELDTQQYVLLITGPNMGGKSTYMRQTALIVLLAWAGCFVPAQAARIGPVDRIFTRIGAADDLASGRSTFMVEMTETAEILGNATAQSLVIMDEIGRGTSTFDGVSIAWASVEYLAHQVRAMTLFATHYFELTVLAEQIPGVINLHLAAAEHQGQVVFLHQVREGPASRSYGLQVAHLAGVPEPVIVAARQRLADLESGKMASPIHSPVALPGSGQDAADPVRDLIRDTDPDALSPRDAHLLLYRLKQLVGAGDQA